MYINALLFFLKYKCPKEWPHVYIYIFIFIFVFIFFFISIFTFPSLLSSFLSPSLPHSLSPLFTLSLYLSKTELPILKLPITVNRYQKNFVFLKK